jgi:diguanylate cyclase (GGDEF)-like protein/PAS domain S-box-containing protein
MQARDSKRTGWSTTLLVLISVFAVACLAGFWVVKDAVTRTVEHQAVSIAQIVASQATTARSVYAGQIADKLQRDGFGPTVDFATLPGHVPIPSQFLKMMGRASSIDGDRLYEYTTVSKWNLEPTQGLTDDFLRWAWPLLEQQDAAQPTGPVIWKPVYRFEDKQGARVLRLLAPDPAATASCVACHNAYERTPEVAAQQGVEKALTELSGYLKGIDQHAVVVVSDLDGTMVHVNDKLVQVSGYERHELIGQHHDVLRSDEHPPEFFDQLWATIRSGNIWRGEICHRTKSGEEYWEDAAIVPLKDAAGETVRFISIRIDITEQKRAESEIAHLATHDSLTGLANRRLLLERMRPALLPERRGGVNVVGAVGAEGVVAAPPDMAAVLFIDLDQFKTVNDSLGHSVGDQLLQEVARRLSACVRSDDTVARQGGDEFIVFSPRVPTTAGAAALAEKLRLAVAEPLTIDGHALHVGASIGVALFPQDGDSVDALLKNSDAAMYRAKETGRNQVCFFTASMHTAVTERFALTESLRHAVARNELVLAYQPIVDTATGRFGALEVLLRWQHPERGLLQPEHFIALAESSGLILGIGEWVLRTACAQRVAWQALGLVVPRLAINVSPLQLQSPGVVASFLATVTEAGASPRDIELEITESSLMNPNTDMAHTLAALAAQGFSFAIDDFGTGYSNLSYLRRFPIDALKIDKSFVSDIDNTTDPTATLAQTVIAMAHSLNLRVTAEGVETPAQLAFLREHGCDQVQGYLLGRPMDADAVATLLVDACHTG